MTISNTLIIISLIFTLTSFSNTEILVFGMNHYHLLNGDYVNIGLQFILYSFIHGSVMHIVFNSLFLYIFGNPVEERLGSIKYIIFILLNIITIGIILLFFTPVGTNTIGISGFALSVLAFYTLSLKESGNPDYKGGITAIIINIMIGFMPGISFLGHLIGAILGVVYYYTLKKLKII